MKVGIASTCLWNLTPFEAIEFAKSNKIFSIEFWIDHINNFNVSNRALKKSLKENNITATIHSISWDINISSFSRDVREFSINEIYKSIDIASEIGAGIVVVHPGKMSFFKESKDMFYKLLADSLYKIIDYASGKNLLICIENMENSPKELLVDENDFNKFLEFAEDKDINLTKSINITMDVAHLGNYARIESFYKNLKSRIKHVHISDLTKDRIHLPIGQGILPYNRVISLLKNEYNGIINLEYFNSDSNKDDVIKSINRLKESIGIELN